MTNAVGATVMRTMVVAAAAVGVIGAVAAVAGHGRHQMMDATTSELKLLV